MHINATFIIQIINFLITYYVLNRFLFHPIIASLKQKQKKETKLQEAIKKEERNIVTLEKEKHEAILAFQRKMRKECPYISPTIQEKPIDITPEEASTSLTQTNLDAKKLQKEVTKFLIEKVPHAY